MVPPIELLRALRAFRAETRAFRFVRQQCRQRLADFIDGRRIELDGRISADLPKAGRVRTAARHAVVHGFDQRQAKPFEQRGKDIAGGVFIRLLHVRGIHETAEHDVIFRR